MTLSADIEPRTYFSSLESAMGDFGLPLDAVDVVRRTALEVDYTHVYIPESRQHIGLEPAGGGDAIAFVFPGFMALHPRDGVSSFVELPQRVPEEPQAAPARRATAAATAKALPPEPLACASCFTTLPATGRCDFCD